jgi:hypothetical protein
MLNQGGGVGGHVDATKSSMGLGSINSSGVGLGGDMNKIPSGISRRNQEITYGLSSGLD